jgi:hypothetical protein
MDMDLNAKGKNMNIREEKHRIKLRGYRLRKIFILNTKSI